MRSPWVFILLCTSIFSFTARLSVSSPLKSVPQISPGSALQLSQAAIPNQIAETPVDGTLLRTASGAVAVIYGGAKFVIPDMDVFTALGFDLASAQEVRDEELDQLSDIPIDGTLLRDTSGGVAVISGGARFMIPSMDVFDTLGYDMANVHQLWDGALDAIPDMIQDGMLLGNSSGGLAVVYGGAQFMIPNMDVFNALAFDMATVHQVDDALLVHIPNIPQDGTLLRDTSGGVAIVYGGAKFIIPSMEAFDSVGYDMSTVHQLWDGALDAIPDVPRDGTRLREVGTNTIYVMSYGIRLAVVATELGGVHDLWSGALDSIPAR